MIKFLVNYTSTRGALGFSVLRFWLFFRSVFRFLLQKTLKGLTIKKFILYILSAIFIHILVSLEKAVSLWILKRLSKLILLIFLCKKFLNGYIPLPIYHE